MLSAHIVGVERAAHEGDANVWRRGERCYKWASHRGIFLIQHYLSGILWCAGDAQRDNATATLFTIIRVHGNNVQACVLVVCVGGAHLVVDVCAPTHRSVCASCTAMYEGRRTVDTC